jgi:Bacterial Ig domain
MRDVNKERGSFGLTFVFLCGLLMLEFGGIGNASAAEVKISSPTYDRVVKGLVDIKLLLHSGVAWANVYIDGVYLASTPDPISWNSTGSLNGTHIISAKAFDASGALMGTATKAVRVKNQTGGVAITSPSNGATVSGTVSIAAKYSSPVSWLNFYIDGTWVASSPPSTLSWNSTSVANGQHTVSVNGYNDSNTLVASTSVTLNVRNGVTPTPTLTPTRTPTPAPTPTPSASVKITSPASGATVSGTVSVVVQYASPVSWLNFYIDGTWVASSPPYTLSWSSTGVANGQHTIAVNGYNSSNALVATSAINVTVKNGTSPTPTPTTKPTATPSSTATPYYSLLPSGSALPSDSQCASGVAGDTYEPRPDNAAFNSAMPSSSELTTYKSNASGGEGGAPGSYLVRADGQFTGTTDAILKWASCKWGFDENVTRATAVNESYWHQDNIGDVGNGISLGILQIKSRDYPSSCEAVASSQSTSDVTNPDCYSYLMTAFAADYKLAQQRACFEGQVSYLTSDTPSSGYPTYPNGTSE